MEISKVGVKLGFYASVLCFLKVAMLLFQGRLEKYLLTFGKMRLFVINHISTVLFFFLPESERTEIYHVRIRFTRLMAQCLDHNPSLLFFMWK